jgi:hypothetical protein
MGLTRVKAHIKELKFRIKQTINTKRRKNKRKYEKPLNGSYGHLEGGGGVNRCYSNFNYFSI